jgi:lipoprotein-anchoring transpeptidase ErfK/SrfK
MLVVAMLAAAGGVYAYDSGRETLIPERVSIGNVDVGGLQAADAEQRLQAQLLAPLKEPVVVRAGDERYELGAREARIRANISASVAEAVATGRDGSILTRTWRGLSGATTDRRIDPEVEFSAAAVQRLVDRVRVDMSREARDAEVDFETVSVTESKTGRTIDAKALKSSVIAALTDPSSDREVRAKLEKVAPKVSTEDVADKYPTILVVDRSSFRIRLYKNLEQVESYPIALGAAGQETPSGLYDIQNKAVNPAWHVPNSDWAGELAGRVIPPGPDNPIKSRWLGIYDGVGVHGTSDRGSIGSNASKGCIRMLIEDVEALYERVDVGAPIYIS